MTRERAIELIGAMKGDLCDFYDYDDLEALDMAISALSDYEKMQEISLDLAFENDELINKSRWIPVSEKLPSDCGHDWVLAQIQEDNGYLWIPCVAEYRKLSGDWFTEANEVGWLSKHKGAFKVIAWMPLPEPYKADMRGNT